MEVEKKKHRLDKVEPCLNFNFFAFQATRAFKAARVKENCKWEGFFFFFFYFWWLIARRVTFKLLFSVSSLMSCPPLNHTRCCIRAKTLTQAQSQFPVRELAPLSSHSRLHHNGIFHLYDWARVWWCLSQSGRAPVGLCGNRDATCGAQSVGRLEPQDITRDTYISVAMNPVSSDRKRKRMKTQQRMETAGRGVRGGGGQEKGREVRASGFEAFLF